MPAATDFTCITAMSNEQERAIVITHKDNTF